VNGGVVNCAASLSDYQIANLDSCERDRLRRVGKSY
jgi:hypothetical protein